MSIDLNKIMAFRVVHRSIIENILAPGAKERFRVVDYPLIQEDADGVLNNDRVVSVYFNMMKFKRGSFRYPDPDATYHLDLLVSSDSKADLLVLDQIFENEQQDIYFNALNDLQDAKSRAENAINEFIEMIYQLIMDPLNDKLGVDRFTIDPQVLMGDRDITKVEKGAAFRKGNKVLIEARMDLDCNFDEKIFGGEEILSAEEEAGGTINGSFDMTAKN